MLVNLPFLADPEWFAQLAFEDLAGRVAGQGVDKIDGPRHLVGGDTLAREADQFIGRDLDAGFSHHERLHGLAPLVVRDTDHRHVRDREVGQFPN